jgi:uncharacterized protein YqiB (DUF1249 family)
MICESNIVPECIIGPGSFGGLMALYEGNFIKFRRLVGGPDGLSETNYLSKVSSDFDLFLSVEASTRYTQDVRLTYHFAETERLIADPDLRIRVYGDARMTEVTGWADHHQHTVLRGLVRKFTREIDKRWSRNMMLSKWLDYLTEKGHSFRPITQAEEHCGLVY